VFHHPLALASPPFQADWAVDPRQCSCITGDCHADQQLLLLLLLRTVRLGWKKNKGLNWIE
jgi:hypothetical protein